MISQTKQKGFTIVELLIVIVIIGILAAISIVAYNGVTQKARDDQRLSDARNIANAAASYNAEIGTWLTPAQMAATSGTSLSTYSTVKVDSTVIGKIQTATTPVLSTTNDKYIVTSCGSPQTGVSVTYLKEADGTTPTIKVGAGC